MSSTSGRSSRSTFTLTKCSVHHRGDVGVLEALVGHHVAPVAGRVADRQRGSGRRARRPRRTPRRPTGTSRPGCRRAGGGTGWSRRRGGSPDHPTGRPRGTVRPWRSRWRARSRWSPVRRGASARRSPRPTPTPAPRCCSRRASCDDLEAAAAEIGGDVDVVAANAGDPDQAAAAVEHCVERFGGIDILVNNAATNPYMGPTMDIDLPALRQDVGGQPPRRCWCGPSWRGRRSMHERGGVGHQHRLGRRASPSSRPSASTTPPRRR